MDHVRHIHTGRDTGDTGQHESKEEPIISAAELAGETGGISCSTSSTAIFLLIIVISVVIIASRIRAK